MSSMNPLLRVACLLLCFAHAAAAQDGGALAARKLHEFGDVLPTHMAAILDGFAAELESAPSAHAFIIVYRSHRDLPGLSARRADWMRGHLLRNRNVKADRVVAVDGGTAACLWHELWLVPPGGAPKPRPDAYSRGFADTSVALKFDEYDFTIPEDMAESFSAEYEGGFEGFADALLKQPRSLGYVIAYAGHRTETWDEAQEDGASRTRRHVVTDPRGMTQRELRRARAALVRRGVPPSRLRLVDGGYRRWRAFSFWVVPRGARPPVPTPNVYPPRPVRRSN